MAHLRSTRRVFSQMSHPETTTTKVPPFWEPTLEESYPFRIWLQDIDLWVHSTEVPTERRAPSIVLRLGGTARALAREVPAATLAHGTDRPVDPPQWDDQGQPVQEHRTGVDIILDLLRRRFAPFEQESQIRVLNDFFRFRRDPGEDADSLLSRFELILYRANQTAQFTISVVGKSWMLLHHLRVPMEKWPQLLINTNGNLPVTDEQYIAFTEYTRRNAHLWEGVGEKSLRPYSHSSGQTGYYNEGRDDTEHSYMAFGADYQYDYDHEYDDSGCVYNAGHHYDEDDAIDMVSDSSEDDDETKVYVAMSADDLFQSGDMCADASAAYHAAMNSEEEWYNLAPVFMAHYRRARARIRKFLGRKPKRFVRGRRFGGKRGRKGGGKFGRSFLQDIEQTYKGSFKGKGKSKGKGFGKSPVPEDAYYESLDTNWDPSVSTYMGSNPKDSSGRTMECHGCGSTDHLVLNCPKRGKGKGGRGRTYFASELGIAANVYTLAQSSSPGNDPHQMSFANRRALFDSPRKAAAVPELHSLSTPQPTPRVATDFGADLESISQKPLQISSAASVRDFLDLSSSSARSTSAWNALSSTGEANETPWQSLESELSFDGRGLNVETSKEPIDMHKLYPVWSYASRSIEAANLEVQYHVRSRLASRHREGLLIDPGAIMNLCGGRWMKRQNEIAKLTGRAVKVRPSQQTMRVEGVGKGSQECTGDALVPICLKSDHGPKPDLLYEASFIKDSDIPALLGLDTLRRRRAVLDCYNGIMYEIAEGDYEIKMPTGSAKYSLEAAESGHWMLPCSDWPGTAKHRKALL